MTSLLTKRDARDGQKGFQINGRENSRDRPRTCKRKLRVNNNKSILPQQFPLNKPSSRYSLDGERKMKIAKITKPGVLATYSELEPTSPKRDHISRAVKPNTASVGENRARSNLQNLDADPRVEDSDRQTATESNSKYAENSKTPASDGKAMHSEKPSQKAVIGPGGGIMELYGYQVHFPRNAVKEDIEFELSVDNNRKNFPTNRGVPIAPILEVRPSIEFGEPVTVKLVTWYSAVKGKQLSADVMTKEENEDWKEEKKIVLSDRNEVSFLVSRFSKKIATVSDKSSEDGIYHFINEIYIQRDTGCIVSAFHRDELAQAQSESRFSKSEYVLATPLPLKISGKLDWIFNLTLNCEKPNNITYKVCSEHSHFKIFSASLDQDTFPIFYYAPDFPEDYRGSVMMTYSIAPPPNTGREIQTVLLSRRWPISTDTNRGNVVNVNQGNSTTAQNVVTGQSNMETSPRDTSTAIRHNN